MSAPSGRPAWFRVLTSLPVRLAVTIGLLALLALTIDWQTVRERVQDGSWGWLVAGVALLFVALVAGARRWQALLAAAEVESRWAPVFRAYMVGTFTNNFLPTGFGGDAVRAISIAPRGPALARAATTVLVDRITAFACLIALAWLTVPFEAGSVPVELLTALTMVSAGALIAAVLAGWAYGSARLRGLIPERLRPLAIELHRPLRALLADRGLVARVTAFGFVYQGLLVASAWAGARAIELELSYPLVAVSATLVLLLTVLPISIAGFGVREGGYVAVLGAAGVGAATATLFSLVTVVLLALASLPGAFFLLAGRRSPAPA